MYIKIRDIILGADLSFGAAFHQMVASSDKSELYSISKNGIQKLFCSGASKKNNQWTMDNCKWNVIETKLKFPRDAFIAFTIPEALATELCK